MYKTVTDAASRTVRKMQFGHYLQISHVRDFIRLVIRDIDGRGSRGI